MLLSHKTDFSVFRLVDDTNQLKKMLIICLKLKSLLRELLMNEYLVEVNRQASKILWNFQIMVSKNVFQSSLKIPMTMTVTDPFVLAF